MRPGTLKKRPSQYPGEGLVVQAGQLYCTNCSKNVGSGKQAIEQHLATAEHKQQKNKATARNKNKQEIISSIAEIKAEVAAENDGNRVVGLIDVPEEVQAFRAEVLEELLKAGIAPNKINRLRNFLTRRCGISLTRADHLIEVFLQPLRIKEKATFRREVKDEDVGIANDGTTHNGESHAWTAR